MHTISRIALTGAHNTRDLGGFPTQDGRRIREKRLLRSGALAALTDADCQTLKEAFHLHTVVDFRTATERAEKPDRDMPGVRFLINPILDEAAMGITRERATDTSIGKTMRRKLDDPNFTISGYMSNIYRTIIADPRAQAQYRQFFTILQQNPDGAILWHCTAGKDRVGTGTAMLLTALGVSQDLIFEDYLMTNQFTAAELAQAKARTDDPVYRAVLDDIYGVKPMYLETVFSEMIRLSGSVRQYLQDRIGLTDDVCKTLQQLYLKEG